MRITKIKVKNLRQNRDTEIDLAPGELTLLVGANDSGKSSIATVAPRYCLWGTTPGRLQDDLLSHGERDEGRTQAAVSTREMIVTVEFTVGEFEYRVTRRFVLSPSGQGGTTTLTLDHRLGGGDWRVYDPGVGVNKDTQQNIIDLIGTDAITSAKIAADRRARALREIARQGGKIGATLGLFEEPERRCPHLFFLIGVVDRQEKFGDAVLRLIEKCLDTRDFIADRVVGDPGFASQPAADRAAPGDVRFQFPAQGRDRYAAAAQEGAQRARL